MIQKKYLGIVFLGLGVFLWAQSITISGTVQDEYGAPIENAYIRLNDSGNGAVSNANGSFQYTFDKAVNDFIRIEADRFDPKTIVIGSQRIFNIVLEETIEDLEGLVVTSSYGTAKVKEEVVGAITTLESEDIATTSAFESVDKMIEGQVAGLLFEGDSQLGTPTSISIRGAGTLTNITGNDLLGTSTQPLIYIDGVPVSEDRPIDQPGFTGSGLFSETFLNPLARIPEDQIESITVLKDAAAVGFYGADAANGVILITTKKAKKAKLKFSIQNQYGASETINEIKYLNGAQYAELYNEYLVNSNIGTFQDNGVDVNWFDTLNKAGTFLQSTFNASGGSNALAFRAGLGYRKSDEAQIGNELERITGTLNLNSKFKNVNIAFRNTLSQLNKTAPNNYFNFILAPTFSAFDENGDFSNTGFLGIPNPLAAIQQNIDEAKTFSYLGNLALDWSPVQGLKLSTQFGLDYADKSDRLWFSGLNESGQRQGTFTIDGVGYRDTGRSVLYSKENIRWNYNANVFYEKSINNTHNFDAFLGFELRYDDAQNQRELGSGYINAQQYRAPSDADNAYTLSTASRLQKGRSFFTQLNYNYNKKYFLLANLRLDQSSVFGSDTNDALNGGFGASWVASKEAFLSRSEWLRFLRFRASWGVTGNSRIGAYRALGLYSISQTSLDGATTVANLQTAPNPNLGWERNEKWNFGVDLNIFKSLNFTVDLFRDNRSDLIVSRDVPLETGFTSSEINGSSMYNQGIEFTVRTNVFNTSDFRWNTSFNITTLQNKVTSLSGFGEDFSASELARAQRVGSATTTIWGFRWAGVDPATGRNLYNVNGQIIDGNSLNTLTNQTDWEPLGDTNPDFFGGWSNTFTIKKDFKLTILADFKWGQDQLVEDELINKYTNLLNRSLSVNALDRWQQVGDIANNPVADNNNRLVSNSSQFIYDQTYFRIRSVNMSYNMPTDALKWLDSAQLFVNVTNLLYWYREKSPEGRNGIRELRYQYPEMRTVSIGFNLNF